jgi:hypothetical protein
MCAQRLRKDTILTANVEVKMRQVIRWTVPMWPIVSVLLSLSAWHCLFEYAKWRDPGGSRFPLGLPLAILLAACAILLSILAMRRRPTVAMVIGASFGLLLGIGCLVYIIAFRDAEGR